jgi:hypothetical protein
MVVVVIGWLVFLLGGWIYVVGPVLFSPIGYLNRDININEKSSRFEKCLAARDLTEAYAYSRAMVIIHFVLLVGNVVKIILGS